MGVTIARGVVGGLGVAMIIASIAFIALGGPGWDLVTVLFLFVPGVIIVTAVILERNRYRSLAAERAGAASGPGGGEPRPPDGRYRPTEERFVDPTTRVSMQVWVDPSTGERLYVPER